MNLRLAVLALAALIAPALTLTACGNDEQTTATEAETGPRIVEYTVRGEVESIPQNPSQDLMVKHEAIPEFDTGQTLPNGEPKLGMNVMSMPFPAPDDYDLSDLAVGDKVALTFAVQHDRETNQLLGYELVNHAKLPEDTQLDFTPLTSR